MNIVRNVWLHPRETTRYVIEHVRLPATLAFFWVTLLGVSMASYHAKAELATEFTAVTLQQFIVMYILIAPFLIMLFLVGAGLITTWMGRFFKGKGTFIDIYKAIAVGHLPMLLPVPFMLAWLIVDTHGFLISYHSLAGVICFIASVIGSVSAFYLTIGTIAEAHRFGYKESVLTLLIPAALLMGFLFLILVALVTFLTGN
ncbi:Yip1 family protein [Caryophanon tenue]|uniref:Yip1 domain-containing protein n=1 Tax=Caryophanon tenue TaxID=33978 RepID=A0A1C0Y6T5_9BACL|nr:Yip1 family protein [Caryophanon tenue]OCS82868.1 hypothetical protein A6M13_05565 [Caryophanon tenue]